MITKRPKTTKNKDNYNIIDMVLDRLQEMSKRQISDCHECDHNHYIQELQELRHQISKQLINGTPLYNDKNNSL